MTYLAHRLITLAPAGVICVAVLCARSTPAAAQPAPDTSTPGVQPGADDPAPVIPPTRRKAPALPTAKPDPARKAPARAVPRRPAARPDHPLEVPPHHRTAPPPPPPRRPPAKQPAPKSGLTLGLKLGSSVPMYTINPNAYVYGAGGDFSGRFMFGYRMASMTLALGFEFNHYMSKDSSGDKASMSTVMFQPTLELVVASSGPLSVYLSLGVHAGFLAETGKNVPDDETPAVGFHGGLGVRYFLHPRFALGLEGGFQGAWTIDDDGDGTVRGAVTFYGAISVLAVL